MNQSSVSAAPGLAAGDTRPARPAGFRVPVLATQLLILAVLFGAWEAGVRAGAVSGLPLIHI